MSDVVERNDVDISTIFNWGRVFEVVGYTDNETVTLVYMRLLGDADLNRARVYAMRESAELRRRLKDPNSDEYMAYLQDIDDVETEELLGLITAFSMRDLSNEAKESVKIKEPKAPKSSASLEEMEKFQKEVDEYPKKKAEAFSKAIDKGIKDLRTSLEKENKETLYAKYKKLLVNEFCERRAMEAFKEMQVYFGCYRDSEYKERFFESLEQFNNLLPDMKKNFIDAYNSLDIDMSELKKLRRATQ